MKSVYETLRTLATKWLYYYPKELVAYQDDDTWHVHYSFFDGVLDEQVTAVYALEDVVFGSYP